MPKAKTTVERKLYFSPEQWKEIERRAGKRGMRPTAYVKDIALHGEIKNYSLERYQSLVYPLRGMGVEINHIAATVNKTKSITSKDVEDVKKYLNDLLRMFKAFFSDKLTYDNIADGDEISWQK